MADDIADDWKMLHGTDGTAPTSKILSTGEMLDRIYRSVIALWEVEPITSDNPPAIIVKVVRVNEGHWNATIEAARMSTTVEKAKSYEGAVALLHAAMIRTYERSIESRQQEIEKRQAEIVKVQSDIDKVSERMARYQRILSLHTS